MEEYPSDGPVDLRTLGGSFSGFHAPPEFPRLEAFQPGRSHQLAEIRRLCRLALKPKGRFAEMNVDAVRRRVAEELDTLRIIHDPLEAEEQFEADPSHSEITGLPPSESDQAAVVGDLIAECVVAMHPAG